MSEQYWGCSDKKSEANFSPAETLQCVVSLSKNINPSLVLVQPRKTRPFITERLLVGHKESNQTKTCKICDKLLRRRKIVTAVKIYTCILANIPCKQN